MSFYAEMEQYLKVPRSKRDIERHKMQLVRKLKLKKVPTDIDILLNVKGAHKKNLVTKPTRTISGVVPIAVMTSPARCPHGKCIYCPGGLNSPYGDVPQSYTGKEPSTMRAMRHAYDPFLIVFNRLEQFVVMGHSPQKVQLIIMGGTFPAREKTYQDEVMRDCFAAMNCFGEFFYESGVLNKEKLKTFFEMPGELHDVERVKRVQERMRALKQETTLQEEQHKNESAFIRCIGITVETKPDWGFLDHGNTMLEQGVTKVELGIQTVYDHVSDLTHRGHTMEDSYRSIQELKDLGFKLNFHYMLGLPETTKEMDVEGLKQLFTDDRFRPDMLKIYPTSVAQGTVLYQWWKRGKFKAITTDVAAEILAAWKPTVPRYCRIMRVLRDVPTKQWEAGVDRTNFRQFLHQKYNITCNCIRCREPRGREVDWNNVVVSVDKYASAGGTEYFISADDKTNDFIVGFCRMRFPGKFLRKEITPTSALIRELHVYGSATPMGKEGAVQHRGFGKQLLQKAEDIAREEGKNKLVIISGIGVRKYYEKLGYQHEGPYMVKEWKSTENTSNQ